MIRTEERDEEARLLSPEVIGASDSTRTDAANLRGTQEEVSYYLGGGFCWAGEALVAALVGWLRRAT